MKNISLLIKYIKTKLYKKAFEAVRCKDTTSKNKIHLKDAFES